MQRILFWFLVLQVSYVMATSPPKAAETHSKTKEESDEKVGPILDEDIPNSGGHPQDSEKRSSDFGDNLNDKGKSTPSDNKNGENILDSGVYPQTTGKRSSGIGDYLKAKGKRMASDFKYSEDAENKTTAHVFHRPLSTESDYEEIAYTTNISDPEFNKMLRDALSMWDTDTCFKFVPLAEVKNAQLVDFLLIFSPGQAVEKCALESTYGIYSEDRDVTVFTILLDNTCREERYVLQTIGLLLEMPLEDTIPKATEHVEFSSEYKDYMNTRTLNWSRASGEHSGYTFDMTSIMLPDKFHKSRGSSFSLTSKDIRYQGLIGRNGYPSFLNKYRLLHWGCYGIGNSNCGYSSNPCKNKGFMGWDCECVCPTNALGNKCEKTTTEIGYYEPYLPSCSKDILLRDPISIETPYNDETGTLHEEWCVFNITAPKNSKIRVKFIDVEIKKKDEYCRESFLEIREEGQKQGKLYCGDGIGPKDVYVSKGHTLGQYLDVKDRKSRGFYAGLEIVTDPKAYGLIRSSGVNLSSSIYSIIWIVGMMIFQTQVVM